MYLFPNIFVNADDLGLSPSINLAILKCFEKKIINSTSLLTNTYYFDDTVNLIHENLAIKNIGVHINLAEGKPVSDFGLSNYLDAQGNWDILKINRKINFLNNKTTGYFEKEITAQIDKALAAKINITHLDSHYHLHTLPAFYSLFLNIAKRYQLKLRLAQTYQEGSNIKFIYRKYINRKIRESGINFSDHFETVTQFLNNTKKRPEIIEIMLHPDFDNSGILTDHYDPLEIKKWMDYLKINSL